MSDIFVPHAVLRAGAAVMALNGKFRFKESKMKNIIFVILALLLFGCESSSTSGGNSPIGTSSELDTSSGQGDADTDLTDRIAWYESLEYGMFQQVLIQINGWKL